MMVAIIQARMSSSRLPGKILKPLLGEPMIVRQVERVLRAQQIDKLVIATSTDPSDDALEELCQKYQYLCYRGSLNDVLDRYYQAASTFGATHVARITADCPLIDPTLIDRHIIFYREEQYDYVSNTIIPSYPDGLDAEIFSFPMLEEAWNEATLPSEREHVTPFIRTKPERFRIGNVSSKENFAHLRWTVDYPSDFALVEKIYKALFPTNPTFHIDDILKLYQERPELCKMNSEHMRDEGLKRSQELDLLVAERKRKEGGLGD